VGVTTTSTSLQKLVLRENLERHLVDTITAFVNAIESKDHYLKGHSARVSLYAGEIATIEKLVSGVIPQAVVRTEAGKTRQVPRHQLPADRGGRIGAEEMDALGNHVVGQHQVAEHCGIVVQTARGRVGGDQAQAVDEGKLTKAHCISPARMLNIRPL